MKWAFSMKEEKISFEQVKDFQKKYPGDLIAFTVDRVLEFNRSPYFVPRSLTYSQLQTLSSSSVLFLFIYSFYYLFLLIFGLINRMRKPNKN